MLNTIITQRKGFYLIPLENLKFKTNLGSLVRPCFNIKTKNKKFIDIQLSCMQLSGKHLPCMCKPWAGPSEVEKVKECLTF